jgi:hypothetical protein
MLELIPGNETIDKWIKVFKSTELVYQ